MIHTSLNWILPLFASSQIIVGQRWPSPRWFIGTGTPPPPGDNFVVADGVQVTADGDNVVAPS